MKIRLILNFFLFIAGNYSSPAIIILSKEQINGINKLIAQEMAKQQIPGASVSIMIDGKPAWSHSYGFSDLDNNVRAEDNTEFRSASIGKTFTATAILQLAEEGIINLDSPVTKYCPHFPQKKWTITIKQLLQHQSGIRHYRLVNGEESKEELYSTKHYNTIPEALELFKNDTLLFEPGTDYYYSTNGYMLLGCVIQDVTGMNFWDYMYKNIFAPAGMISTVIDDPSVIIKKRAKGYVIGSDSLLHNSRWADMSNKIPAGGYVTTASDLIRFCSVLLTQKLLKRESLDKMFAAQILKNGDDVNYGMGWALSLPATEFHGHKVVFHGGGTPQVSNMLYMLPDLKFAVAVLMNRENIHNRLDLVQKIAEIVLKLKK